MKKLYENLQQLFEENRDDKEDDDVVEIINELSVIRNEGTSLGGSSSGWGCGKAPGPRTGIKRTRKKR